MLLLSATRWIRPANLLLEIRFPMECEPGNDQVGGGEELTLMGVVRQAVKASAGSSGLCGSSSWALQAASTMTSFMGSTPAGGVAKGAYVLAPPLCTCRLRAK